jgi:hypothetical protein
VDIIHSTLQIVTVAQWAPFKFDLLAFDRFFAWFGASWP